MDGGAAWHGRKAALPALSPPPSAGLPHFALASCSCWGQLYHAKAFEENCGWRSADNCFVSDSLINLTGERKRNKN